MVDPPEDLRAAAGAVAELVAKNSPTAMAITKKALWEALELDLHDACAAGAKRLPEMWGHADQEEGPVAFTEKRDADWLPLDESQERVR